MVRPPVLFFYGRKCFPPVIILEKVLTLMMKCHYIAFIERQVLIVKFARTNNIEKVSGGEIV